MADYMMPNDFMEDGFDQVMGNYFVDGDADDSFMNYHNFTALENDDNPKKGHSTGPSPTLSTTMDSTLAGGAMPVFSDFAGNVPFNSIPMNGIPHRFGNQGPTQHDLVNYEDVESASMHVDKVSMDSAVNGTQGYGVRPVYDRTPSHALVHVDATSASRTLEPLV